MSPVRVETVYGNTGCLFLTGICIPFYRLGEKEWILLDSGSRFVRGEPGAAEPDDFSDEICLAVDTPQGLVVLVGCSHPGILNMIARVHEALHRPVYGVFGGTHLVEADEARIRATLEELRGMGLQVLGLSHCSGTLAEQCLHSDGRVTACHMAVGNCLAL